VSVQPLSIQSTGMITCVGFSAPASCAAIRATIANFSNTPFMDHAGEWIVGAQVPLEPSSRGTVRLVRFLANAVEECLEQIPRAQWVRIPVLLCLAERERPGRPDALDETLWRELSNELGTAFHPDSRTIAEGRVSAAIGLRHAQKLLYEHGQDSVVIAGSDSYLISTTLRAYEDRNRLRTSGNSNGFIAGEGGAAIQVTKPIPDRGPTLQVHGLGFGVEDATVESSQPLLAKGLTRSVKAALVEAGVEVHDLHFRVADLGGEQYYFKEAALAITRLLRERKDDFDLWHPSDCIGDTGAAAGLMCLTVVDAAQRKGYAPGPGALLHFSADAGARAGVVTVFG